MAIQFANKSSISVPRYSHLRKRKTDRKREGNIQYDRDQSYEGEFLRDSLHGQGTYDWADVAVYDGGFYSNCKEGYASISFPDNSYFEGLFVGNRPFGPGIFTHPNGRQDAGFWKGRKLVRLSRVVDFIIPRLAPTSAAKIKLLQFRRLIPVDEENPSVTDILEKYGHSESISAPFCTEIYDKRSIFFDKRAFEKAYFLSPKRRICLPSSPSMGGQCEEEYDEEEEEEEEEEEDEDEEEEEEETLEEEFGGGPPPHCVCPTDVFVMQYEKRESVDVCERERDIVAGEDEMGILGYFNKYGTDERLNSAVGEDSDLNTRESVETVIEAEDIKRGLSKVPKIVSWNRNELCTEMLKQIFRFRNFEGKLNFNLSKLMVGARTAFRKTGENEMQCLQFLKMCSLGPAHVVKGLLCAFQVSEELMDGRGNNSLMFAAATDRRDVIEVLLNYGVDLNTFNDEGLTPLNLCLLRRLAYANGISNWETAFLPKEIDETQYEDPNAHGYPTTESISSLDRIFGDGMSLEESSMYGLGSALVSPPQSPPAAGQGQSEKRPSGGKGEASKTVLSAAPKTQGSLSVINWEWDFRPGKSVSIVALSNPTPTLNIKIVPKSVRRDEFQRSMQRSNKDKYLFEIKFEKKPEGQEDVLNLGKKRQVRKEEGSDSGDESSDNSVTIDVDVSERIAEIDKTITLLLEKGADTNISEVPKPSIHLALHTKDIKTVHKLLIHGANPDSVLHENEGLLTPLHVIALQKPTLEYVHICDLLLNFKADPDKETLPGYSFTEDEIQYLDFDRGRTPLHLLCMRPDLEYADPNGYLIRIALMLAKAGHKKHLYNGHSYLTLAMLFGNMKLLKALLVAQVFDPREILGNNRGTCLHVLVSGELQKRTSYDSSVQMCDMLIRAGADPLKTFKNPRNLLGTCVDYGYRELGMLREARYSEEFKGIKRSFSKGRDSLRDHEKVLEYLAVIVGETAKRKHKLFLQVGRFQRYKPSTDRWRHRVSRRFRSSRASALENVSSATFTESEDRMMKASKETYASLEEKASKLILPSRRLQMRSKSDTQERTETQIQETKEVEGKKEKKGVEEKKEKWEAEDRRERKKMEDRREKREIEERKERRETQEKIKRSEARDRKEKKETHDKRETKETRDKREAKETHDKKEKQEGREKKDKKGKKIKAKVAEEETEDEEEEEEESDKLPKKKKSDKKSDKKRDKKEAKEEKSPKRGVLKQKNRMRRRSDQDLEEEEDEDGSSASKGKHRDKTKKGEEEPPPEKGKRPRKDTMGEARGKDSNLSVRKRTKKDSRYAMETVFQKRASESWKGMVKGKFSRRGTIQGSFTEKSQLKQGKMRKDSIEEEKEPKKGKKEVQTGDRSKERSRKGSKEESKEGSKEVRRGSKRGETQTPEKEERPEEGKAETGRKEYSSEAKEGERSQGATRTSVPSISTRGRGSNAPPGGEVSSLRSQADRRSMGQEVFPENLRKVLLRLYGSCAKMDVNEFLMPYVVLRDGQLYYKFKGKATKQKEQYSLI